MKRVRNFLALFMLFALLLSACSALTVAQPPAMADKPAAESMADKPADGEMAEDKMTDEKSEAEMMGDKSEDEMMDKDESMADDSMAKDESMTEDQMDKDESMADDSMADKDDSMMAMPGFFNVALTDAASGKTFTLADFKGKVVLVENLAMWCPKCLNQQKEVKALHGLLGERDDFVSVGLDVDPNEDLADLRGYIASNGFDWYYAIAPVEVAREISQLYGANFLNPPSTPMFIIDRHGEVHLLPFGVKSAQELRDALEPFLNDDM